MMMKNDEEEGYARICHIQVCESERLGLLEFKKIVVLSSGSESWVMTMKNDEAEECTDMSQATVSGIELQPSTTNDTGNG